MDERGRKRAGKRSSLKKKVGPSQWLACNAFTSNKPALRKGSRIINNISITDLSINGIWSESVVNKLLDALSAQHFALENLCNELDVERDASAVAIDDTLLMISRLQEEKSSLAMQHNQYYRETQQKMALAQQMFSQYEDVLEKKNEEIRALQQEVQSYRERYMLSGSNGFNTVDVPSPATPLSPSSYSGHFDGRYSGGLENFMLTGLTKGCLSVPYLSESSTNQSFDVDFSGCKPTQNSGQCDVGLTDRRNYEEFEEMQWSETFKEENTIEGSVSEKLGRNNKDFGSEKLANYLVKQVSDVCPNYDTANQSNAPAVKILGSGTSNMLDMTHHDGVKSIQQSHAKSHLFPENHTPLKSNHDEMHDALTDYIACLKEGRRDQQGVLFSRLYEAAEEAAREEHMSNCLNYYHWKEKCEEDSLSQMFIRENSCTNFKTVSSQMACKLDELSMRVCALEKKDRSLKRAINYLKQNRNQIRASQRNAQNLASKVLMILACLGLASSAKDLLSKAFVRAWGVFSFFPFLATNQYLHITSTRN